MFFRNSKLLPTFENHYYPTTEYFPPFIFFVKRLTKLIAVLKINGFKLNNIIMYIRKLPIFDTNRSKLLKGKLEMRQKIVAKSYFFRIISVYGVAATHTQTAHVHDTSTNIHTHSHLHTHALNYECTYTHNYYTCT